MDRSLSENGHSSFYVTKKIPAWLLISIFLLVIVVILPVSGKMSDTMPSFPLSNTTIGFFETKTGGGYPLFNHPYALFTEDEYRMTGRDRNQTLSIFPYYNPPLFPNETIYGILHQENRYVSWVKEYTDPITGVTRLCQVADTGEAGEQPYDMNLSPADNDYLGRIDWFFVNGKMWPRTWINGTMYEGQRWSEWWGPFTPDDQGSVFRKRDAVVTKGTIPLAGDDKEVYIVSITGPSEFFSGMDMEERFYFADGVGPLAHEMIEINAQPLPLSSEEFPSSGAPSILPAGEIALSHGVICKEIYLNDILALYPR